MATKTVSPHLIQTAIQSERLAHNGQPTTVGVLRQLCNGPELMCYGDDGVQLAIEDELDFRYGQYCLVLSDNSFSAELYEGLHEAQMAAMELPGSRSVLLVAGRSGTIPGAAAR